MNLLEVDNLVVETKTTTIINNVCLEVFENEIVALVGESGSGKSMIARSIMGLLPSEQLCISSGSIEFQENELLTLPEQSMRKIRGRSIAYIPQSPLNALNPMMSIERQLIESFDPQFHEISPKERALFLLKRVGFLDPERIMKSMPYQLSGGMRQRVLIAISLMNAPKLLIADEPTTALDVTLQAEILDLLQDLKQEYGLGILFITHDLGLVARYAERGYILFSGKIVEEGPINDLFYDPKETYTKLLLSSLIHHPTMTGSIL